MGSHSYSTHFSNCDSLDSLMVCDSIRPVEHDAI